MTRPEVETKVRGLLEQLSMPHALTALEGALPKDAATRKAVLEALLTVVAAEVTERTERRIARRIRDSKLPDCPTLAGFDFDFQPKLDRELVLELSTLSWVDQVEDLVLTGDSGTGKSHLAKALCLIGCSQGRRVRYTSCADMLAELYASLADRSLASSVRRYTRPSLLLIDDLGYDPIEQEQAREAQLLYKVLEARHGKVSTIITSNLSAEQWATYLGDHYLTVALLDRLLYRANAINIEGPSYRLAQHHKRQKARQKMSSKKHEEP
jgi:DNA replication protein DnaC